jgi:hypothetical protein
MDIYARLFCVCVAVCVGSGLAMGWSPFQGVLSTMHRIKRLKMRPRSTRAVEPQTDSILNARWEPQLPYCQPCSNLPAEGMTRSQRSFRRTKPKHCVRSVIIRDRSLHLIKCKKQSTGNMFHRETEFYRIIPSFTHDLTLQCTRDFLHCTVQMYVTSLRALQDNLMHPTNSVTRSSEVNGTNFVAIRVCSINRSIRSV